MNFFQMPKLTIGNTTLTLPIVQGGMGVGISLSRLASAVANEGGIGVIAANAIGMIEPDYRTNGREANIRALRNEIRKAKTNSKGAIGVNLMVAVNNFQDMLAVTMEEKADFVFLGAGLPIKNIPVKELRAAGVKVVPIVSSGRAAKLIFKSWEKNYNDIPDAVVVEGPKAGGHLGFSIEQLNDPAYSLNAIVPEVVNEIALFESSFKRKIPVIAAGGIFTGNDIYDFLKLGASGVQMATRFVATDECDADRKFKESYVSCKESDLTIIKSPVGMPGRAIKNTFLENAASGIKAKFRCPWRCLASCEAAESNYCISEALDNARRGELDKGFAFAGSNAWMVNRIMPVKELVSSLKSEYETAKIKAMTSFVDDYKKFKEKIGGFMDNYGTLIGARFANMKTDYDEAVEMASIMKREYEIAIEERFYAFKEDYEQRILSIKEDYEAALEKAALLKEEFTKKFKELTEQIQSYGLISER